MDSINITVVIPTYNRRRFLDRTISRIMNQSFPAERYEVIVVDDCSNDGTSQYLNQCEYHDRIRILTNEVNSGRARTRNRGIKQAVGKYILMIDDDIIADNTLIERHYAKHKSISGEAAVVGAILPSPDVPRTAVNRYCNGHHEWAYGEMASHGDKLPFTFCKTANLSLLKESIERTGYFDESFVKYGAEDTEFGYRLSEAHIPIYFEKTAIGYHFHNESLDNLILKFKDLIDADNHFHLLHPGMPTTGAAPYKGFFTPDFHTYDGLRSVFYNLVKTILFSSLARNMSTSFVRRFNTTTSLPSFFITYLFSFLRMQYQYAYKKRMTDENRN
jgi:glycosyltransferase involved in cell wall biosynthesis